MKIVQIEDFFHPDAGYQVNILSKYLSLFGHEVYIFTSKMDLIPIGLTSFFGKDNIEEKDSQYELAYNVKIMRFPLKHYISSRSIYDKSIFKKIDEINPDVVFVHGNDTYIAMQMILRHKNQRYPLVSDSHMIAMASVNKLHSLFALYYRCFISPKIKKYNIPIIRTQDDFYVVNELGVPAEQCPYISLGSDTLLFHPDAEAKRSFRAENGISDDDFVVVYTGKLDEAKGGKLLAQAFHDRFETERNIVLVVVGNTSGDYGNEVERIFSESENRILRFPTQKYCDLAKFYQAADLSVFAKQCSLSFYDAQACGLPVLSEDNNINVDRCSHENGWNFKAGDINDFREKIQVIADMSDEEFKIFSNNAYRYTTENYNYKDKAYEYIVEIEKSVEKHQQRVILNEKKRQC